MRNEIELKAKIRAMLGLRIGVIIYFDYDGALNELGFKQMGNVALFDDLTLEIWRRECDDETVYLSRGKS
jgi:hypothetical protein